MTEEERLNQPIDEETPVGDFEAVSSQADRTHSLPEIDAPSTPEEAILPSSLSENDSVPLEDSPPAGSASLEDTPETAPLESPLPVGEQTADSLVAPLAPAIMQPRIPAGWPQIGIPSLPVALLLVGLGLILVWPQFSGGFTLVPAATVAILIAGTALSLFAYWLRSRRRARGAFFIALLGLIVAGLTGFFVQASDVLSIAQGWPLYLVGAGIAILMTYIADRGAGRWLPATALALVSAGLVALAANLQFVPTNILDIGQQYWRWLIVILVIGLLPLAFHRRSQPD